MRSAIDRPAASSFDELMRRPEDRRCIDVASDICEPDRLRWASIDAMLVLIERDMMIPVGLRRFLQGKSPARALAFRTPSARCSFGSTVAVMRTVETLATHRTQARFLSLLQCLSGPSRRTFRPECVHAHSISRGACGRNRGRKTRNDD